MKRNVSCAVVSVAIVFVAACGGKQSMASKSANAYRDAVARGIPVAAGGHGGHMATQTDGAPGMAGMDMKGQDRSNMAGMDMKGKDQSNMAGMDMKGKDQSNMAGMDMKSKDRSNMAGMNMKGKDRSNMAGMDMKGKDQSNMAGMQHGGTQMGGMGGMNMDGNIPPGGLWGGLNAQQRGAAGGATAMSGMTGMPARSEPQSAMANMNMQAGASTTAQAGTQPTNPIPAPRSSVDLGQVRSSTLSTDPQDVPSPISVAEAVKAAAPMAGMSDTPGMGSMPGMQMNQTRAKETDLYVCPMHPDDTSPHPGAAKCGMQMVRKRKK